VPVREARAPHIDGEAAWQAANACIGGDMAGVRVDMAAAIGTAIANGCAPEAAAQLVMAVNSGLQAAQAKRRAKDVG
jgi:hypothetical protein